MVEKKGKVRARRTKERKVKSYQEIRCESRKKEDGRENTKNKGQYGDKR